MNRDNLSALAVGIGVIVLIAGFGVYFNNPALNKAASGQQDGFVPAATSGNMTKVHVDKSQFKLAPELAGISGYINTDGQKVTLADLKGKVVIVDFWTYSCINCIRTIPYLNAWYKKYADDGLVLVGVHTPEFEFERNYDNVKNAVEKFGIKYPVVQDNDRGTWNAYQNRYWPHKFIVDDEGYIRYDHIGEGGYADTEKVIQSLLAERAAAIGANATVYNSTSTPEKVQGVDFGKIRTPELYFGYDYARAQLGNSEGFKPGQVVNYSIPEDTNLVPSRIYLGGEWKNNADNMELAGDTGRIVLVYSARAANIVAGGQGTLQISEDGSGMTEKGSDVSDQGQVTIDGQRLYNLSFHEGYGEHTLVIDVSGKGFQIYTFTFG